MTRILWGVLVLTLALGGSYLIAERLEARVLLSEARVLSYIDKRLERIAPTYLIHGILRPDTSGKWFIQVDNTHSPSGLDLVVTQASDHLRIFFSGRKFSRAGSVQISSDDGFGDTITGHSNLGLSGASIQVLANGKLINPADVWKHLPPDRRQNQNGNFWITIVMIE